MTWHRIVETANLKSGPLRESFVSLPLLREDVAEAIADAINARLCPDGRARRFWKVVENGYELQKGFEP